MRTPQTLLRWSFANLSIRARQTPKSVLTGAELIMSNARGLIEEAQCKGELAAMTDEIGNMKQHVSRPEDV